MCSIMYVYPISNNYTYINMLYIYAYVCIDIYNR